MRAPLVTIGVAVALAVPLSACAGAERSERDNVEQAVLRNEYSVSGKPRSVHCKKLSAGWSCRIEISKTEVLNCDGIVVADGKIVKADPICLVE